MSVKVFILTDDGDDSRITSETIESIALHLAHDTGFDTSEIDILTASGAMRLLRDETIARLERGDRSMKPRGFMSDMNHINQKETK